MLVFGPSVKKWTSVITLALGLMGSGIYIYRASLQGDNDFKVYYRTSMRMNSSQWDDIYTLKDGRMPFRYSPIMLPFFKPFSLLPEVEARAVWASLQVSFFAAGFYFLYLCLRILEVKNPLFLLSLSFLSTFRYYLDSLLSGQISGIKFFGFSAGIFFYLRKKTFLSSLALLPGAFFKVGPGILHVFLCLNSDINRAVKRVFLSFFLGVGILTAMTLALVGPFENLKQLWEDWLFISGMDSKYFDGACSKSQSLRGLFMRMFSSAPWVQNIWYGVVMGVTALASLFWYSLRSQSPQDKTLAYSLGIILFILLMPQSLPYALVHLAIPVLFLLAKNSQQLNHDSGIVFTLAVFALFCSIPGSDVVGFTLAEWIQNQSLPVFAVLGFLGTTTFQILSERKKAVLLVDPYELNQDLLPS